MRIVIDMQGAQTTGSRNRGIGRYTLSLVHALLRRRGDHQILLALNGLFPDSIAPIRSAFEGVLPAHQIHVWHAPGPVGMLDPASTWRRHSAQLLREAFLARLEPDIVLVTSLFEGLADDFVGSIGMLGTGLPTAVILYDLIPLIQRDVYLASPAVEQWYETRLDALRRADLLLAISESSRQEGLRYLDFAPDDCVNISTAADPHFAPQVPGADVERRLRERFGLRGAFLMYTGGIDHRKNIEGLVRAYARLDAALRETHQLAIICSIQPQHRSALDKLAREHGLAAAELVLTGFVSEDDLTCLYNLCTAFVFPSWHEGFGLPALEAMSCGRAVIGASTSSVPEVIGRADALFDPHDEAAMAQKIAQVLGDAAFRGDLERHGIEQARRFSWDASAGAALAAMERWHARRSVPPPARPDARPTLAYLSPLPPERSGISDYSAELLPELARHYQIDVIVAQDSVADPWVRANCAVRSVAWFRANVGRYERVLYHFGNSTFHQHMFALLAEVPGVVVLHDYFLSGIAAHLELTGTESLFWARALYDGHGYPALRERYHAIDPNEVMLRYPCNLSVLRGALGTIVHSDSSRRLAMQWNGPQAAADWHVIPLLRVAGVHKGRASARRQLGLADDDFVVCSFGLLAPSKLNHRLLAAWGASALAREGRCVLVFVGENAGGPYGAEMLDAIRALGPQVRVQITGWTDTPQFRRFLAAADVGVQLRTRSRGETSAAVLDCMNYALPTIINANGSLADLPDEHVIKLPDVFEDRQLIAALEALWRDPALRARLGEGAHAYIRAMHAPRHCADLYAQAIESTYRRAVAPRLMQALARLEPAPADDAPWERLAAAMALNLPTPLAMRQLLIDVSALEGRAAAHTLLGQYGTLPALLLEAPPGWRVEPVYLQRGAYLYARRFSLRQLECPEHALPDDVAEMRSGDKLLVPGRAGAAPPVVQYWRDLGVEIEFVELA